MSDIRISVIKEGRTKECSAPAGVNLLTVLKMNGFTLACCAGKGICGRCKVRFHGGIAPIPTASERIALSLEELRGGYRLACMQKLWRDCELDVCFIAAAQVEIVSECKAAGELQETDREEDLKRGATGSCIVAVDLGTTTIAMQAIAMSSAGRTPDIRSRGDWEAGLKRLPVLAQFCCMNPQRPWGSDVVSRIQGEREALHTAVCEAVSDGLRRLEADLPAGVRPDRVYIAGNTVMEHLLSGLSVEGMGSYPFKPVCLDEQKVLLQPAGRQITLLPGISSFVGADITAGLLACGFAQKKEGADLFLDLGTNGEMAVGNAEKLLCAATAAGPAFEGGSGAYLPGTDMVAVMAEMLERGIMDRTGLMKEPYFEDGYEAACTEKKVLIRQKDVRALQMAKAAVHAGILILMKEYGVTARQIGRVYLAGGFGYYLDVGKAALIGLFPSGLADRVEAVGNTSLFGAYLYGIMEENRKAAKKLCGVAKTVNLAEHPEFEKLYLKNLEF